MEFGRGILKVIFALLVFAFAAGTIGSPDSFGETKKSKASAKKSAPKKKISAKSVKKVSAKSVSSTLSKPTPAKPISAKALPRQAQPAAVALTPKVDEPLTVSTGAVGEEAKTEKAPTPEERKGGGEKKEGSAFSKAAGKSDNSGPVYITSESLKLDAKDRVFTYYDNVKVVRGDTTILADKVTGRYNAANEIERAICEHNVVITRGETMKATSNRADYDVKRGVIVMTESPELNDKGSVLNADKVTVYVNEDRSEAEGHVRVKVLKTDQSGVKK